MAMRSTETALQASVGAAPEAAGPGMQRGPRATVRRADWLFAAFTEGTRMCLWSCVGNLRAEIWALFGCPGLGGWLRVGRASLRKS